MWKSNPVGRSGDHRVKIRQVSIGARLRPRLPHEESGANGGNTDEQLITAHPSSKCVVVRTGPRSKQQSSNRRRSQSGHEDEEQNISGNKPKSKAKKFFFDFVFDENTSQAQVYRDVSASAVHDALKGSNAVVLAYGQTGAGKTYSIFGPSFDSNRVTEEDASQLGMIPRAMHELFEHVEDRQESWVFHIHVSFLQLYMNKAYDLLTDQRGNKNSNRSQNKGGELDIRDGPQGAYVEGLTSVSVSSIHDALEILEEGEKKKVKATTVLNADSSRSHTVLMVDVYRVMRGESRNSSEGLEYDMDAFSCRGKLTFFDLAGSERTHFTGAAGKQLEEAKVINKSLSALGNVVSALSSAAAEASQNVDLSASASGIKPSHGPSSPGINGPQSPASRSYKRITDRRRSSHRAEPADSGRTSQSNKRSTNFIPWRDSKLTKLLQASLLSANDTGDGSVSLLLNLSPNNQHVGEALSTMMFGARARGMAEEPIEFAAAFGASSLGFLPDALNEAASNKGEADGETLRTQVSPLKDSSTAMWDDGKPSSHQYYRRLALALQRRYDALEDKSRQTQSSLLRQYEEAVQENSKLREQLDDAETQLQDTRGTLENTQEAMEQLFDDRTRLADRVHELENQYDETLKRAEAAEELAVALAGSETGDDTSEVIGWSIRSSNRRSPFENSNSTSQMNRYFDECGTPHGGSTVDSRPAQSQTYFTSSVTKLDRTTNSVNESVNFNVEESLKYHAECLDKLIEQVGPEFSVQRRAASLLQRSLGNSNGPVATLLANKFRLGKSSNENTKKESPTGNAPSIEAPTRKPKKRDAHSGPQDTVETLSPPPMNKEARNVNYGATDGARRAEASYKEVRAALSRAYELFEASNDLDGDRNGSSSPRMRSSRKVDEQQGARRVSFSRDTRSGSYRHNVDHVGDNQQGMHSTEGDEPGSYIRRGESGSAPRTNLRVDEEDHTSRVPRSDDGRYAEESVNMGQYANQTSTHVSSRRDSSRSSSHSIAYQSPENGRGVPASHRAPQQSPSFQAEGTQKSPRPPGQASHPPHAPPPPQEPSQAQRRTSQTTPQPPGTHQQNASPNRRASHTTPQPPGRGQQETTSTGRRASYTSPEPPESEQKQTGSSENRAGRAAPQSPGSGHQQAHNNSRRASQSRPQPPGDTPNSPRSTTQTTHGSNAQHRRPSASRRSSQTTPQPPGANTSPSHSRRRPSQTSPQPPNAQPQRGDSPGRRSSQTTPKPPSQTAQDGRGSNQPRPPPPSSQAPAGHTTSSSSTPQPPVQQPRPPGMSQQEKKHPAPPPKGPAKSPRPPGQGSAGAPQPPQQNAARGGPRPPAPPGHRNTQSR